MHPGGGAEYRYSYLIWTPLLVKRFILTGWHSGNIHIRIEATGSNGGAACAAVTGSAITITRIRRRRSHIPNLPYKSRDVVPFDFCLKITLMQACLLGNQQQIGGPGFSVPGSRSPLRGFAPERPFNLSCEGMRVH